MWRTEGWFLLRCHAVFCKCDTRLGSWWNYSSFSKIIHVVRMKMLSLRSFFSGILCVIARLCTLSYHSFYYTLSKTHTRGIQRVNCWSWKPKESSCVDAKGASYSEFN